MTWEYMHKAKRTICSLELVTVAESTIYIIGIAYIHNTYMMFTRIAVGWYNYDVNVYRLRI